MSTLMMAVDCPDMPDGGSFSLKHTGRGGDVSPAIRIRNLAPDVKTLAVMLEDTSHPLFRNFTHWLLWDVPAADRIPEAIPAGKQLPELGNARQGIGYGVFRYAGPKPPKGHTHTYRFTVYGLNTAVGPIQFATKSRFLRKAQEHIVQKGQIELEFE